MKTFQYFIKLDERGSFSADVRDESGQTVFTILAGDELGEDESSIFEDGFMKHKGDLVGLRYHLINLGIMTTADQLTKGN